MTASKHTIGDPAELASLYHTGAMDEPLRAAFERHLDERCPLCTSELRQLIAATEFLADMVTPVDPSASARSRLMQWIDQDSEAGQTAGKAEVQVWRAWTTDDDRTRFFTRRADDNSWEATGVEGVSIRRLFVDRDRNQFTALIRMEAGASYPRHVHNGPEECLVIEGDLHVGEAIVLGPGDYQRAPAGSKHDIQRTVGGCTLMIISALDDDMIDE